MITARSVFSLHSFHDPFLFLFGCIGHFRLLFYMQRRFRAIHKKPHIKTASITRRILHILCFFIVHHLIPFYFLFLFISNTIQWKTQFNLNKVCFFIHAKSSLYNRLLDMLETAFQKQLTKSTVFERSFHRLL